MQSHSRPASQPSRTSSSSFLAIHLRKWDTLKAELAKVYWQHDKPRNTMTELNELIKIAPEMDLNVYVLKYAAITDVLVSKGGMSLLDRISRLLDGLPEELQRKALGFYTKKKWRLSPHDTTGTEHPVFDELKDFVIQEAQTEQKRIVYNRERAVREFSIDSASLRSSAATVTPAVASTAPATPDPMAELTKQLSQLTLLFAKPGPNLWDDQQCPRCSFICSTCSN